MDTSKEILLRDPGTEPGYDVLEAALGKQLLGVYTGLTAIIQTAGLSLEWRYYKDGKAWLCKVVHKKQTVFWLSAWEGFIRTSFYFTEKTRSGVLDLEIAESVKRSFEDTKAVGKLLPLIYDLDREAQLEDLQAIIRYKKSAR